VADSGGRLRLLGEHPSALLLLAQLVAVLAYPFLDQAPAGRAMLGVVGTVVVLLALAAQMALSGFGINLAGVSR